MRLFGLTITRTKATPPPGTVFSTTSSRGGWYRILEPFSGAWQRGIEQSPETVLTFAAVYACVTLIASDIAKLRIKLVEQDSDGIWSETERAAFSPVLRKPNHYQTRIKCIEQWLLSKLIHGNAYILKARDALGFVVGLYVLDPTRVKPLVAQNGDVYYQLSQDNLSRVSSTDVVVPASEIIHDVINALYHPLCGVSPLTACGLAAVQGLRVQNHSSAFFANGSRPGGILTSPGLLDQEQERQIKQAWEENFSGENQGRIAVLGADLKYQELGMNAVDAQLIDQLKWTAENVCTAYHVPPYMVGVAAPPAYNNIEALNQQYYSQCLQTLIESIELLLDEGLGLGQSGETKHLGTEFDLDSLLRMDTASRATAAKEALGGGMAPNEARRKFFDLGPVRGGESPYLQEQNWPLNLLADRQLPERTPTEPAPMPGRDATDEAADKAWLRSVKSALVVSASSEGWQM